MAKKHVHFVGIGGIGVSALAQWHKSEGFAVSGSDSARSIITDDLKKKGIKVTIGDRAPVPKDASLLIYSSAVPENHPERIQAKKLGIQQKTYAESLGELTKKYKTIAVCGAHGKSTTTAMVALMLTKAQFDPTVIIGTRLKEFKNNNFRKGKSEWLVIEADEYRASFLNYHPYAAICTNIDREHLDFYKDFTEIKKTFTKFFANVTPGGILVLNADDANLQSLKLPANVRVVNYSTRDSRAVGLFKVVKVPGRHNLSNALGCDTLGKALGIAEEVRNIALGAFAGTWRRFEYKGTFKGAKIFDDYGHHPTEIKATLSGAREAFPNSRIWCVHQPHHTSRLQHLFADFTKSFSGADKTIILETYKVKGRENEKIDPKRSSAALAKKIGGAYAASPAEVLKALKKELVKGDVVIIMGAGDITAIADRLVRR